MADRSFIQQIDRGGLIYPSDIVYMSVLHIWTFITEICQHEKDLDVVVLLARKCSISLPKITPVIKTLTFTKR